jgi:hypothetical protein
MTVVIDGDRIADIRPSNASDDLKGMHIIDGSGRFLIPGLWDGHVHAFVFPWQADLYFPLFIANGVTGVRDMGGAFPMTTINEVRAGIASGTRTRPRIVAGTMIDGPSPVWPFALPAGTAEEGRQAVATVADAGADFAKVYSLLPREAYRGVTEAANERGFPFAGHVPISVTAAEASDAGQRTIEHYTDSVLAYCATAEDEILAELRAAADSPEPVQAYSTAFFQLFPRMVETFDPAKAEGLASRFAANGTWLTPTLLLGQNAARAGDPALIADPRLRYMPAEVVSTWNPPEDPRSSPENRAIAEQSLEAAGVICQAMQRSGAGMIAGTDLGLPNVFPGFSLHDELALLVASGLTPLEALQSATRNTAMAVGLGDEVGTVEVGKLADLVLLDADPLAAITNTTRIAAVITNGRLFERPDLDGLLQDAERAGATPMASPAP